MAYFLAALLGGFLFFNSQATPDKAARVMEKTLAQKFPGAQIKASVEGTRGNDVLKGRFKRVHLDVANFTLGQSSAAVANPLTQGVLPPMRSANALPARAATGATKPGAPAGGLSVQVVPNAKSRGRIGTFELQARDFQWNDLQVSALDLHLGDVVFDWKALRKTSQIKLVSSSGGQAQLTLQAAALKSFVQQKLTDVSEPQVQLLPGKRVRVTGQKPMPLVNVPVDFELDAGLEIRRDRELWLSKPQLKTQGVVLAEPLAKLFLRDVNPIYVLDAENQWPLLVRVTDLQTPENSLRLNASVTLRSRPENDSIS